MQEEIDLMMEMAEDSMKGAIDRLQKELVKVRTGKASPTMLQGITVDYYGSQTPLSQVANVGASDARTLTIQPWEKNMLEEIEKAIFAANLGVTPMNNGEMIRINIPPLTEDRRKDLVKKVKAYAEESKVSVRNARREIMEGIKKAVKDGYPEDAGKKAEDNAQNLTNKYTDNIDKYVDAKEKDIMTI